MEFVPMVVEPLLLASFDLLFKKLDNFISNDSEGLQAEALAQLQSWQRILPQLREVLTDAEEKQMNGVNSVKTWLDDLKDLAYDVEDILEEFNVDVQRARLTAARPQESNTCKFFPSCFSCVKHNYFMFDSDTISKVKDIDRRLQRMAEESKTLGLMSSRVHQVGERPNRADVGRIPTTSLPDSHLYGRESDEAAIFRKLMDDEGSSQGYSVIPIVGMGGIGKTALAQHVYNEVKQESFELKAWVCVSDQFDVLSITRSILEAVSRNQHDLKDLKDLNSLQEELKSKLLGKKFLLILDDIWNEEYQRWDALQKPFQSGSAGSKIIVTTRSERVAEIMGGKDKIHHLKELDFKQCLPILAQHALGEDNFDAHPSLKEVGEEIVNKCNGLPLFAKLLGGLLRGKQGLEDWKYIFNKVKSGILPPLMLSYHHLPSFLKQCFAYCAVFPKDYEFDKEELVLLWMAEGLLNQQPGEGNQLEEIGQQFFCELLSRSFFQESAKNKLRYVMHDLIHDLAQFVAGRTCCNLENVSGVSQKSKVNFEKVRHLSFNQSYYDISKRFEVLNEMKSLRTFIPVTLEFPESCLANTVVLDLLPKLRCLRALSLEGYHIRRLPDSIRDLKCLKYLNFSETLIKSLPESIGSLLQLQTLSLFSCKEFSKFPVAIGNLINLHHLDVRKTDSLKEMPSGIANLKDLLTLGKFIVGKENGLLKLSGLENFSQLKGELSILDLHNVLDVHEARKASLDKIDGLDWLLLQWTSKFGNSRNEDKEMQVLNCLKPHHLKLKSLTIICYGGKEFPSWISCPSFSNLSYLKLCKCSRSTSFPSLEQLPALKELIVEGMDAIETVDSKFYGHGTFQSLEKLEFRDMLSWKEWTSTTAGGGVGFPRLCELVIQNCPKLIGQLPSHLSCLKNLVIRRCPELRCPSSMSLQSLQKLNIEDSNVALLKGMADLTSLTSLEIKRISGLVCLPKSFIESLIAIENVVIAECLELTCLWEEGTELENLACLEKMKIERCPLLASLTGKEHGLLPFNLKHLTLSSCKALESLPDAMMMKADGSSSSNNMLRLELLRISNCESLKSLPTTTVKHLQIRDCKNLQSLPDGVLLQDDGDSNSNLESLKIEKLPSLNSVGSGSLPASLKKFVVSYLERLESFPERLMQHCTGLESIQIWDCAALRKLSLDGLSNLHDLEIHSCAVLEFFPEMRLSLPNLRSLTISNCPGLERIPDGGLPLNLTDLMLLNCQNLKSLPDTMNELTSIQRLVITGIDSIRDGGLPPNLTSLDLESCQNLKSLPNTMNELTSLQRLGIVSCPGIDSIPDGGLPPNLMSLTLDGEHLKQPAVEWRLYNLTSLQQCQILNTCPPDIVLPTSLTSLTIFCDQNLKSIPRGLLQNLNSLQCLDIRSCPKLRSLPRKGLPPSLGYLQIRGCPLLKRQRFEEKGKYWSLTRTIPYIEIDGDEV